MLEQSQNSGPISADDILEGFKPTFDKIQMLNDLLFEANKIFEELREEGIDVPISIEIK